MRLAGGEVAPPQCVNFEAHPPRCGRDSLLREAHELDGAPLRPAPRRRQQRVLRPQHGVDRFHFAVL